MIGFFLIDKAKGMNSFKIVATLRKVFNERRIGFVGTLDPLATGLMLVAIGEATKLIPFLEKADKIYEVDAELGSISATYDDEGPITKTDLPETFEPPSRSTLEQILEANFDGEIEQTPPIYSAVWVDGKRAYDMARQGLEVKIKSRKVQIIELKLLRYAYPNLKLRLQVSTGTYIRSIVHDLGQILGCGAYVKELRRVKLGPFKIDEAVSLEEINTLNFYKYLKLPEQVLSDWQKIELNEEQYKILSLGNFIDNLSGATKALAMFKGQCVGVIETMPNDNTKLKFYRKFNIVAS